MAQNEASPPPPPPPLHVLILPWLAFGHMIPLFNLAVSLATTGVRISFLSSPRNIARLPKIPTTLTSLFHFVAFPLSPVNGLPENAEATVDVSFEQQEYLKLAYDMLQHPIKQFILQLQEEKDQPPLCILHDLLPHWIIDIGRVCNNIPCISFSVFAPHAFCFSVGPPPSETQQHHEQYHSRNLTEKPEWVPFPSSVAYRPKEAALLQRAHTTVDASGMNAIERRRIIIHGCSAIAIRSCHESFESEYLELLQKLYDPKPVIPTGILLPPTTATTEKAKEDDCWGKILKWLDTQKQKSVVFVSFGSEYKLTESEINELASGLELSNIPFLWSLRNKPASWVSTCTSEEEGFVTRGAHGQGIVAFGWAPQMEILAHPAIGGSLFHSGWGSIIETLRFGHVLIVLPSIFDQSLNARLVVEKGLGLEVERDANGCLNRDEISRCLIKAMVSSEGEGMRMKAREMGAVYADQKLYDLYVKKFVDYLVQVSPVAA